MIIWKGYGFLVVVIFFAITVILYAFGLTEDIVPAIGAFASAIVVWFVGKKLNSPTKSRTFIDKQTGQEIVYKPDHSLFFVPMQYWAFILVICGIIILVASHQANGQKLQNTKDSIELQRKNRLITEDIQRKYSDGKVMIGDFATELMKLVSPISGQDLSSEIIDEECTYDTLTNTLELVFQTKWDAVPGYLESQYEWHIYKGKVILYGTGENRFEQISENETLQRAIRESENMQRISELLDRIDKQSRNNENQ